MAAASGCTATSSKASERSLQMAAHLLRIRCIRIIITGEGVLGDGLLCISQRMTLSLTSGNI